MQFLEYARLGVQGYWCEQWFGILNAVASEKPRILQDSRDIFLTLAVFAVAMFVTIGFTGLCSFNPGKPENGPVHEVDPKPFLSMESRRVEFPLVLPQVPQGWVPNSTRAGSAGEHPATIIGYVTAEGAFIQVTQTNAPVDALPNSTKPRMKGDVIDVDGVRWQEFTPVNDGDRRVWVGDVNNVRMMLEGSASDDEYSALAVAVKNGSVIKPPTN